MGATGSAVARIDGVDERVDADVAIVDTGIAPVADLNVVGGYNCSTSNRGAWRDVQGHGTHVAGTIGAIDNGSGVVGVAPGVRIWAVKILDDGGMGLLSWYICGLDWIAAQKDPNDPTRPLIEAVNMSVAKDGSDDHNCGATNGDLLHAAICRLVATKVTVAAAAANDSKDAASRVPAAYDEVITVSALADTDGQPGGIGGNRCLSWGGYDVDDTFADFSNYGRDVDLISPGKCIWSTVPSGYKYMSGTSMATPHVTGAIALLKATRPYLSPAEVKEALLYLGTMDWRTNTDPDPWHEKLLDVSRIGPRGDFAITAGDPAFVTQTGGTASIPITVFRTETLFERITLRADRLPIGVTATFSSPSLYGFDAMDGQLVVNVPAGTPAGTYQIRISATEHNRIRATTASIVVGGSSFASGAPDRVLRRN
jgi:subtilisin family serine protease